MRVIKLGRIATMFAAVLLASSTMVSCGPKDEPKPAAAGEIQGPTEVEEGSSIELSIATIKNADTYKWYKDGTMMQNTASRTLTVTAAGTYKVAGVNKQGEGTASANHVVTLATVGGEEAPAAAGTISGQTEVAEGGTIELSIGEIARAETYKWYKDGAEVQNSANRTLSVNAAGVYKVAGVNSVGEGTASPNHTVTLTTGGGGEMDYDESLNNQFTYGDVTYDIGYSEVKTQAAIPTLNFAGGHYFIMSTTTPQGGSYTDIFNILIPESRYGEEFTISATSTELWFLQFFVFVNEEQISRGGQMGAMGTVDEGKAIITKDGLNITVKAVIKFTDGSIIKVKYSGTAENGDPAPIEPSVGEGSYTYNGTTYPILSAVLNESYANRNPDWDMEFALYTGEAMSPEDGYSYYLNVEHCVILLMPSAMFGQTINLDNHTSPLTTDQMVFCYNGSFEQGIGWYYEWWETTYFDDVSSGTMKVTKVDGTQWKMEFQASFTDGTSLSGSYEGTITSIDGLIMDWNAAAPPAYAPRNNAKFDMRKTPMANNKTAKAEKINVARKR